jgi:hypothetical protein
MVVGVSVQVERSLTATDQKNNFRVSFGWLEMGIKPDQEGPASQVTSEVLSKHNKLETEENTIWDACTGNQELFRFRIGEGDRLRRDGTSFRLWRTEEIRRKSQ